MLFAYYFNLKSKAVKKPLSGSVLLVELELPKINTFSKAIQKES